ncbi:MAG: hypothetical protein IJE24_04195 [Oscillospiraceae bacterium]|nr:hypothetical protein [Oscillospiraceae bacterium]
MMRKLRTGIPAAVGLLILILDTKTALVGASRGLELCLRTVIPSLLPFFVLSILLTSATVGENIPFLRPLGRLLGIAKGTESLLLVGMLGGYPAGAQCVAQAYRDGAVSKRNAQQMLAFCNLAGPAFLFGIIAGKFTASSTVWALWGIHLLSAFLVALLLPGRSSAAAVLTPGKPMTLADALQRSLRIMAGVCGWIILFRVIITFLELWLLWLLPVPVQVAITGFLELSNGCCDLQRINNEGLRFVLCSAMLAFGGMCVCMQTASVTDGLNLKQYYIGKVLQTLLCVLLSSILAAKSVGFPVLLWIVLLIVIAVTVKFLHKKQKRCSISPLVGV